MHAGLEMLTQYNKEGESLISRIVTGDKAWLHYWTRKARARPWYRKLSTKKHRESLNKNRLQVKF